MISRLAVLVAIYALGGPQSLPSKKSPAFDPKAYPPNKFKISRKDYPLGGITVRITQVRNEGYTIEPDTCRGAGGQTGRSTVDAIVLREYQAARR